jgi:hypothetical protein
VTRGNVRAKEERKAVKQDNTGSREANRVNGNNNRNQQAKPNHRRNRPPSIAVRTPMAIERRLQKGIIP